MCEFCKRGFTKEKTLIAHLCSQKERFHMRSEKKVKNGFEAYRRFWRLRQNPKQDRNWEDFEKSDLYLAFVRFGKHIVDIHAINPLGFVDFLIRGEVGIDDWCKPSMYENYVRELTKNETPIEALKRNIELMEQWANKENEDWTDFFRKVAPAQAVMWVKSGRISPLMFFTASSAPDLLARLSDEQRRIIESFIDVKFWEIKISRHQKQVDLIVKELATHNV